MKSERFIAYKKEVVAVFEKKREKAEESWLVDLNRRKIWARSIELIENGVEPSDHRALSDYLKMQADDRDYLRNVKEKDGDYFQGLFKFLDGKVANPADSTIEFLSWMIDFPKRPFSEYIKADSSERLEPIVEPPPPKPPVEIKKGSDRRQIAPLYLWISGISLLILFAGLIWWFWPTNDCMYWNDDHYVESPCNVPKLDTPLFTLDRAKLRGFRQIKKIDTISYYAVGKFWFTRVGKDNRIEIFTARGGHPLYPDKKLKEVTDYIVNTCNPNLQRH